MSSSRLYVDESGFTGSDLISREQPLFVVGSLWIDDSTCQLWSNLLRQESSAAELKYSTLSRWSKSRNTLLQFARELDNSQDKIRFSIIHKQYALMGKLLEAILEPYLYRNGCNFYAEGRNLAYLNTLYSCSVQHPDACSSVLLCFLNLCREPSHDLLEKLRRSLVELGWENDTLGSLCRPILDSIEWQQRDGIAEADKSVLELQATSLLTLIRHWNADLNQSPMIIADHSKEMSRSLDAFKILSNPELSRLQQQVANSRIALPIRVGEIKLVDSSDYVGVQLADVATGIVSHVANAMNDPSRMLRGYSDALIDIVSKWPRMLQVVPHNAFTPEELGRQEYDGMDLIHYTQHAIYQWNKKGRR